VGKDRGATQKQKRGWQRGQGGGAKGLGEKKMNQSKTGQRHLLRPEGTRRKKKTPIGRIRNPGLKGVREGAGTGGKKRRGWIAGQQRKAKKRHAC